MAGPKMHKTASTTLGGILARAANKYKWQARLYGTTHPLDPAPRFGSRFRKAEEPSILYAHVYGSANEGNPSDVMLLPSGKKFKMRRLPVYDFLQLQTYYQKAVPGARLVVSLREPLARYISMRTTSRTPSGTLRRRLMATLHSCSSRRYGSTSNEEEAATTSRAFWACATHPQLHPS